MVTRALVLDGMAGHAIAIDQQQVNTLGIDAGKGVGILAAKNLAEGHLSHDLPIGVARFNRALKFAQHTRFGLVEERLNSELGTHHNAKLVGCIRPSRQRRILPKRAAPTQPVAELLDTDANTDPDNPNGDRDQWIVE